MASTGTETAGTSPARAERLALCALLEQKGPLAPTLCEGWTTADLAAHLFVREARPWAGAGILVPVLSGITERAMDDAKRNYGYEGLIRRIRSGPPALLKALDAQMNTLEYFVHHEDVRRAGPEPFEPRDTPGLDAALWQSLKKAARLFARRVSGAGLELVAPGFGRVTARAGEPKATMTGSPQELTLYLFGRKSVAHVELEGSDEARAAVEAAPFGV